VFREGETQVSPVTMSRPAPWLHPVRCYKRPLKEEKRLLPFETLLWAFVLGGFTLGFCFWGFYFGLFGVGSFWKGKELLKGKC
jgi:hypothetical protein